MHELSIVENLLNIVESVASERSLKRITKIHLQIGSMRQVVPEMFSFAFDVAKEGTVAQSAQIEMTFVQAKAVCRTCKREFTVDDNFFVCPGCSGVDVDVVEGKELLIQTLEGE